jgi:hypothetical protein
MRLLRRLLVTLRPARARYGREILLAGWVQVPKAIREIIPRR